MKRNANNNMQITRILKCLGEFEMELYQIEFLNFMLEEVFKTKELDSLGECLTRYWIYTIKDDYNRRKLIDKAKDYING